MLKAGQLHNDPRSRRDMGTLQAGLRSTRLIAIVFAGVLAGSLLMSSTLGQRGVPPGSVL